MFVLYKINAQIMCTIAKKVMIENLQITTEYRITAANYDKIQNVKSEFWFGCVFFKKGVQNYGMNKTT